jgi:hypothetical protein
MLIQLTSLRVDDVAMSALSVFHQHTYRKRRGATHKDTVYAKCIHARRKGSEGTLPIVVQSISICPLFTALTHDTVHSPSRMSFIKDTQN